MLLRHTEIRGTTVLSIPKGRRNTHAVMWKYHTSIRINYCASSWLSDKTDNWLNNVHCQYIRWDNLKTSLPFPPPKRQALWLNAGMERSGMMHLSLTANCSSVFLLSVLVSKNKRIVWSCCLKNVASFLGVWLLD